MNAQNKKRAAVAAVAGFALLAVGSMAVFMDSKKIDLSANVGTLDLSADAVLTHTNAYADAAQGKNTGLQANNLNPGDNDHTVNEGADPAEKRRDGTDHELNIHVQNDGNKSMITRTLLVVTGQTDGIHGGPTKQALTKQALKNVLLYLNDAQNDTGYAALPQTQPAREAGITAQMPAGLDKVDYTVWPVTSTKVPGAANARYIFQTWNEADNTVGVVKPEDAAKAHPHTSIDKTANRTITADERTTQLNPAKGGATQVNTGKTEKLVPLNGHTPAPAYWSAADLAKLFANEAAGSGYGINDATSLVYEVHRNMVLGGAVKAPGVTEYETLGTAMGKNGTALKPNQLADNQPYVNKTALEKLASDATQKGWNNMVPSSKEFILEVGLDKRVGDFMAQTTAINNQTYNAGDYYHPELEGATINIRVIVQAMQFRNTSDNLWKTLFTKDVSVGVA